MITNFATTLIDNIHFYSMHIVLVRMHNALQKYIEQIIRIHTKHDN